MARSSVAALATLGACVDDPVAPKTRSTPGPNAAALARGWVEVTGYERERIYWLISFPIYTCSRLTFSSNAPASGPRSGALLRNGRRVTG